MSLSVKFPKQTVSTRMRARPLTLKEVLRLRDGMKISKTSDSNHPYQTHRIDRRILFALN